MAYKSTDLFAKIIGPLPTYASARAARPSIGKWIDNFKTYADKQWSTYGASWSSANYYDRVAIYYAHWQMGGETNTAFRDRARQIAINYRTYVIGANGQIPANNAFPVGLALHYLETGDQSSLDAVRMLADWFCLPYYRDNLGKTDSTAEMDNRIQAYFVDSLLMAHLLNAPSKAGNIWAQRLEEGIPKILSSQSADGAYRFQRVQMGNNKPFMVGLLDQALARYQRLYKQDAAVQSARHAAGRFIAINNWIPTKLAYEYMDNQPASSDDGVDLNNLIINSTTLYDPAQALKAFDAAVIGSGSILPAWLDGTKQLNQVYASAHTFLMTRFALASAWSDGVVEQPPPPPPPSSPPDSPPPPPPPVDVNAEAKTLLGEAKTKIDAALAKL